jgi:hypothetical protein
LTYLESERPKWLIVLLCAHIALLAFGFLSDAWLLTAFCVWVEPRLIQTLLQLVWLVLTVSPLIGFAALRFPGLRKPYLMAALAMPLFQVSVLALNGAGVLQCDAP